MTKHNEPTLLLKLKPSRRLMQIQAALHILACIACFASSLSWLIKTALTFVVCSHAIWVHRWLSRQHFQIRYTEHSSWEMLRQQNFEPIVILASSISTIFVIILHIKSHFKEKLTILVVPDALCEDEYRQLNVNLKTISTKNKRNHVR